MPRVKDEHDRRGTTHQVGVRTHVGIKNWLGAEIGASLLGRHHRDKTDQVDHLHDRSHGLEYLSCAPH